MKKFKKISIIIPVFNEEKYLNTLIKRVAAANTLKLKKEIILVDDGSKDRSIQIIKKLALYSKRQKAEVKMIFKKTNEGKGSSVKAGFLQSTGDIVLVQDADLEYDVNDYPAMLEPFIKYNADVVYGSRLLSNRPHRVLYFWHYFANNLLTTLSNMLTNLNLTDMETGFKAFKGDLIRQIAKKLESKKFGFEPEITARVSKIPGIKIYEVGILYHGRTYEEGKKIDWRDGLKAIWEILKYNLISK